MPPKNETTALDVSAPAAPRLTPDEALAHMRTLTNAVARLWAAHPIPAHEKADITAGLDALAASLDEQADNDPAPEPEQGVAE